MIEKKKKNGSSDFVLSLDASRRTFVLQVHKWTEGGGGAKPKRRSCGQQVGEVLISKLTLESSVLATAHIPLNLTSPDNLS